METKQKMKPVVKVSKLTGDIVAEFKSGKDAVSDAANSGWQIGYNSFCRMINNKSLCNKRSPYFYRWKNDFVEHELYAGKYNRPVFVINLETKKLRWFPCLASCAEALAVVEGTIREAALYRYVVSGTYRVVYQPGAGLPKALLTN